MFRCMIYFTKYSTRLYSETWNSEVSQWTVWWTSSSIAMLPPLEKQWLTCHVCIIHVAPVCWTKAIECKCLEGFSLTRTHQRVVLSIQFLVLFRREPKVIL